MGSSLIRFAGLYLYAVALTAVILVTASEPATAIVKGKDAAPGHYTFIVGLIWSRAEPGKEANHQFCGGSLIAPQWVLTAAHCLLDPYDNVLEPAAIHVLAGSYDLSDGERIRVSLIKVHPDYKKNGFDNDIALIRLQDAPKTKKASIIKMSDTIGRYDRLKPRKNPWEYSGSKRRNVSVIGWGLKVPLQRNPPGPRKLQILDTVVADPEYCERRSTYAALPLYGNFLRSLQINSAAIDEIYGRIAKGVRGVPLHTICTSTYADGVDGLVEGDDFIRKGLHRPSIVLHSPLMPCLGPDCERIVHELEPSDCQGDSGGPLFSSFPDEGFLQVGVVSYGPRYCGLTISVSVYTDVAAFQSWIRSVIAAGN